MVGNVPLGRCFAYAAPLVFLALAACDSQQPLEFTPEAWQAQTAQCSYFFMPEPCTRALMLDSLMEKHPPGSSGPEAFKALGPITGLADGYGAPDSQTGVQMRTEFRAIYPLGGFSTLRVNYDRVKNTVVAYDPRDADAVAEWSEPYVEEWARFKQPYAPFDAEVWREQSESCIAGDPLCTRPEMIPTLVLDHLLVMANEQWPKERVIEVLGPAEKLMTESYLEYTLGGYGLLRVWIDKDTGKVENGEFFIDSDWYKPPKR